MTKISDIVNVTIKSWPPPPGARQFTIVQATIPAMGVFAAEHCLLSWDPADTDANAWKLVAASPDLEAIHAARRLLKGEFA